MPSAEIATFARRPSSHHHHHGTNSTSGASGPTATGEAQELSGPMLDAIAACGQLSETAQQHSLSLRGATAAEKTELARQLRSILRAVTSIAAREEINLQRSLLLRHRELCLVYPQRAARADSPASVPQMPDLNLEGTVSDMLAQLTQRNSQTPKKHLVDEFLDSIDYTNGNGNGAQHRLGAGASGRSSGASTISSLMFTVQQGKEVFDTPSSSQGGGGAGGPHHQPAHGGLIELVPVTAGTTPETSPLHFPQQHQSGPMAPTGVFSRPLGHRPTAEPATSRPLDLPPQINAHRAAGGHSLVQLCIEPPTPDADATGPAGTPSSAALSATDVLPPAPRSRQPNVFPTSSGCGPTVVVVPSSVPAEWRGAHDPLPTNARSAGVFAAASGPLASSNSQSGSRSRSDSDPRLLQQLYNNHSGSTSTTGGGRGASGASTPLGVDVEELVIVPRRDINTSSSSREKFPLPPSPSKPAAPASLPVLAPRDDVSATQPIIDDGGSAHNAAGDADQLQVQEGPSSSTCDSMTAVDEQHSPTDGPTTSDPTRISSGGDDFGGLPHFHRREATTTAADGGDHAGISSNEATTIEGVLSSATATAADSSVASSGQGHAKESTLRSAQRREGQLPQRFHFGLALLMQAREARNSTAATRGGMRAGSLSTDSTGSLSRRSSSRTAVAVSRKASMSPRTPNRHTVNSRLSNDFATSPTSPLSPNRVNDATPSNRFGL